MDLRTTTTADIESMRRPLVGQPAASIQEAAQVFATELARAYPAILLSRVFVTVPFGVLSPGDQKFAMGIVGDSNPVDADTPVLTLMGTSGRDPSWCDRSASRGHLAIPLASRSFVSGIPMISALLSSLDVDLAALDADVAAASYTRRMLGGLNGAFYVSDARTAVDAKGRAIISPEFVRARGVRTVFGMGGPYFDGTLIAIINFADVEVDRDVVDRFASLVSFFKLATKDLVRGRRLFRAPPVS
jgi:hypothetical protein